MAKTISTGYLSDTINGIKINSSLKCASSNYTNTSSRSISYIVMHYTANKTDTAASNAKYFSSANRGASAHFFVDDKNIYQSVELRDKAWHCGTSGKYYHASCRNANSFGIEMCCVNGDITSTTEENAAQLCAFLCKMLGISASQVDTYVLRHYDITHKNCPAPMVSDNNRWNNFKNRVKTLLGAAATPTATKPASSGSNGTPAYTKTQFIKDIQKELGCTVDGVAGPKTLAATITLSTKVNSKHPVVVPVQKYLNSLGYNCGTPDGALGSKSDTAIKAYQKANGCTADGEITRKGKTWQKLLGLA